VLAESAATGWKIGGEASGARRGEPRCPDTPPEFVPAMTARAFNTEITDKIIAELEAGRIPWVQPIA